MWERGPPDAIPTRRRFPPGGASIFDIGNLYPIDMTYTCLMALGRATEAGRRRRRKYSSPLRERQKASTRDLVMRGLAKLIAEGKILTFTVQEVADQAGVSYAAVYRHFPTREALLEELNDWAEEVGRAKVPPDPRTIDDIPPWVDGIIPVFEENPAAVQAMVMASAVLDLRPQSRARRDRMIEKLVRDAAPRLSEEDRRHAYAVIRLLASAQTWAALRRRFSLDGNGAARAVTWALRTLIEDVRTRNVQSPPRRPKSRTGGSR